MQRKSSGTMAVPGTVQVVERSPSLIRTRIAGRFDDRLCTEFIAIIESWRGTRNGVVAFHDATAVVDYDVAARERVSRWSREQHSHFESIHMLVERRLVAWGINIISMVSGANITTYHSSESFENAYARYSRGAR